MRFRRVVPVLYAIALAMLLMGALLLVAGGAEDEVLNHAGEVMAGLAWPIAAVGALLDTLRHQLDDARAGTGGATAEGGPDAR